MARALAEAFVRVRADTSSVRKDIRNDFDKAGSDGGRAFGDSFNRDAEGKLRDSRGRLVRDLGDAGDDGGRNAGDRFASAFSDSFRRIGPLLTKALGGSPAILGKLATGARVATIAITGLAAATAALNTAVQAGAALAPLTGGLLLIPGAALAAAAGIGTLKLATSGLGDAFSAAMSGDTKKFKESLQGLAPAAQSVAKEMLKLRPTLLGVRNAAQQALFAPLVGQMTALAKVLAGPVRTGVSQVANQFGLAGKQAAEFARQSATVKLVRDAFVAVGISIRTLRPALEPVLAGFRALAQVGLGFLPGLANSVAQVASRFGQWLQQISASGQAARWISDALATLKQLGGVVSNVGGILRSVFSAASAAGSGFLGVIGTATAQLNTFLKTAAGRSALTSVFQGLAAVGSSLAPVIAAVVKGLGALAAPVGRLAQLIGPILATAINALAPALAALEPGLRAIFVGLGGAVKALAPALVPIAQGLAAIGAAIGPVLPVIVGNLAQALVALAPGAKVAFGALAQAIQILAPVLPSVGQTLGAIAVALAPLLPLAAGLASVVAQALVAALRVLIPVVQPIVQALTNALLPVLPQLSVAFTNLVLAFLPLAAALGPAFAKTITDLAPTFANLAVQLAVGLLPAFTNFVNAIVPFIPDLVRLSAEFGYLAIRILPPLMPLLITLAAMSLELTTNFLQLVPHVSGFVGALASIFTIGGVVGLLANIGGAVGTVGNFIVGLPGKILGALNWVIKNIPNAFSSAWRGAYNATVSIGQTTLNWIGKIPGAIVSAFSGASKWLYNAGRNIVIGLWNGVVSLWNWLISKFHSLTNLIPRVKGPPEKDRKLLTPAGVAIMQGFGAGISSQVPVLKRTLAGVTATVSQTGNRLAGAASPAARSNSLAVAGAGASGSGGFDINALADGVAAGIARANIGIHMDKKQVGQIVSAEVGKQTALRRRTG